MTSLAAAEEPFHPFTLYAVRERDSNRSIGGLGFFGPPDDGIVEVGYGLVPSARGCGYATEALLGAIDIARTAGALRIIAEADPENFRSQNVLLKAGFTRSHRADGVVAFSLDL